MITHRFWIVFRKIGNGTVAWHHNAPTRTHSTFNAARDEAVRLTGVHQCLFYVMEVVGCAEPSSAVVWYEVLRDGAQR